MTAISLALGWNYEVNVNYLDGTCFLYSQDKCLDTVDYLHENDKFGCVKHSGDIMDWDLKSGQHTIEIDLKKVPKNVSSLFLCLSAWQGNLSAIRNPWMKLFDQKHPDVELCKYVVESATTSQAGSI